MQPLPERPHGESPQPDERQHLADDEALAGQERTAGHITGRLPERPPEGSVVEPVVVEPTAAARALASFEQEVPQITPWERLSARLHGLEIARRWARRVAHSNPEALIRAERGQRALVLLSGGLDCTVVLFLAKAKGLQVTGLEFENPLRPEAANLRTKLIAEKAGVSLCRVRIPDGVLTHESGRTTVVPLRESNALYYAMAGNIAHRLGLSSVLGGQILDDWRDLSIPQALPSYFRRLNALLRREFGSSSPLLEMPFIYLPKPEVLRLGMKIGAPVELTSSCSVNETTACEACEQCRLRAEAFRAVSEDLE